MLFKTTLNPFLGNTSVSIKPFEKILQHVTFCISGYKNPTRSEVRCKAIEMGATYKTEWDNSCSHLM